MLKVTAIGAMLSFLSCVQLRTHAPLRSGQPTYNGLLLIPIERILCG